MAKLAYTVLVADDEYWIRENLRNAIDWEAHSFHFMEPAEDGEQALERVRAEAPDILISDISMPFLSGAELIELVRKEAPGTVCVALSGYSDYNFVRAAMVAGALDYLLKPITVSDLLAVLAKAVSQLQAARARDAEHQQIQQQLKTASSAALDRDLSVLIHLSGDSRLRAQSEARAQEYELSFSGFTMVMLHTASLAQISKAGTPAPPDARVMEIKELISRQASGAKSIVFNYTYKTNEFFLITDMEKGRLLELCTRLAPAMRAKTGHDVMILLGRHYFSFSQLRDAYNELRMALYGMPYRRQTTVVQVEELPPTPVKRPLPPEIEKQLQLAARTGNHALFQSVVEKEMRLPRCSEEGWSYIEVRQVVDHLIWLLRGSLTDTGSHGRLLALDNLAEGLLQAVDSFDAAELHSILLQMMDETFGAAGPGQSDTIRDTVLRARDFIDQNYAEELSLTLLSEMFHVESSYLSRAFRQQLGDNLMLYISKKRVEKAIEYMEHTKLSLTEISQMVGYGDYTYFNRVFRKVTGASPREYKAKGEGSA